MKVLEKFKKNTLLFFSIFVFINPNSFAKEYIIYNMAQDFPMGFKDEVLKKNYYINMGTEQGVKMGDNLNVFRTISIVDPYASKSRYNYNVKIGEVKVIHSEGLISIAEMVGITENKDMPYLEIRNFMIGDRIGVKVD